MENLFYRQEIQEIAEHRKPLNHIGERIVVQAVDSNQGNDGTDQSDHHTLYHEGKSGEEIRSAQILHQHDLHGTGGNTHCNGRVNEENTDCQKYRDNSHADISDQQIRTA